MWEENFLQITSLIAQTTFLFELYRTDILNTILERDGIFLFYFQYVSKQFQGGAYMEQELTYFFHLGSDKNKSNIDRVKKNK